MNNPLALVIVFFAVCAIWGTFMLTILIFVKGARIGEGDIAYRDDSARTERG